MRGGRGGSRESFLRAVPLEARDPREAPGQAEAAWTSWRWGAPLHPLAVPEAQMNGAPSLALGKQRTNKGVWQKEAGGQDELEGRG